MEPRDIARLITEDQDTFNEDWELFYVGGEFLGNPATFIPGYSSNDPNEPAQFANPALYEFEFDYNSLIEVEYVNGRENDPEIKRYKPGAKGEEGKTEVVINVPVTATIVDIDSVICRLDHKTREYFLAFCVEEHPEIYNPQVGRDNL